jgi:hypothetical protein
MQACIFEGDVLRMPKRALKFKVQTLEARAKRLRELLEEMLDDDEDMVIMVVLFIICVLSRLHCSAGYDESDEATPKSPAVH